MEELKPGTRVDHPRYGEGIISRSNVAAYEIFFARGGKVEILKRNSDLTVLEKSESTEQASGSGLSLDDVEKVLTYILDKYNALSYVAELGEKWHGGTLELKPSNPSLKSKEIPVEIFFHKIVMARDRLRVLEQNINSHPSLSDEEKINLQQYITRIYGSLTTFNILFADKDDYFIGVKS